MFDEPSQQDFVHLAAEPLDAVDFNHRDALVVACSNRRILVDIDLGGCKPVLQQQRLGIFAEMAANSSIENDG